MPLDQCYKLHKLLDFGKNWRCGGFLELASASILCAAPTFRGILDRGYELSFWKVLGWRKHTRKVLSTSMRVCGMGVQSTESTEVFRSIRKHGSADCARGNRAYLE